LIDADVLFAVAALTWPGGVEGEDDVDGTEVAVVFAGATGGAVVVVGAGPLPLVLDAGVVPRAAQAETVSTATVTAARTATRIARLPRRWSPGQ
jgi:hypothetical protein